MCQQFGMSVLLMLGKLMFPKKEKLSWRQFDQRHESFDFWTLETARH
jgi:hypothetical protein